MDTRANFQRLLDDMDEVIRRKQRELSELDECLEVARVQLSDREAKELLSQQTADNAANTNETNKLEQQDIDNLMLEQRAHYEQQITNLNNELIELESDNQSLSKSNSQLRFELDSMKVSNEKLKGRLHILNENLEEIQSANFELNIRLAKAESESQMQQKLLKKSHEQDQILMDAFNNKLEALRDAIESRDNEIRRLNIDNQLALESLGIEYNNSDETNGQADAQEANGEKSYLAANDMMIEMDNSNRKHGLVKIANMIKEKDAKIEELNSQLITATRELENSASLFETINKEKSDSTSDPVNEQEMKSYEGHAEKGLTARCSMLEDELLEKDKQLHLISKRNRHFERILPTKIIDLIESLQARGRFMISNDSQGQVESNGNELNLAEISKLIENLNELLNETSSSQRLLDTIDQLQRVVLSRDGQIKHLVRELNRLNAKINQDQIDLPELDVIPEDENATGEEDKKLTSVDQQESSSELLEADQDCEHAPAILKDQNLPLHEDRLPESQVSERVAHLRGSRLAVISEEVDEEGTAGESSESLGVETKETTTPLNMQRKQGTNDFQQHSRVKSFRLARDQNRIMKLNHGHRRNNRHGVLLRHQTGSHKRTYRSRSRYTMDNSKRGRRRIEIGSERVNIGGSSCRATNAEQAFNYRNRLKQLENENQLLELAMKEILMSIKWSDTRCSTILIDCPSLERLCQLIEARYISTNGRSLHSNLQNKTLIGNDEGDGGAVDDAKQVNETHLCAQALEEPSREINPQIDSNIFHSVVMKSELDILRGQNEQLRSDLKLHRREYNQQLLVQSCRPHHLHESDEQADDNNQERHEDIRKTPSQESQPHELGRSEAECQTDSLVVIEPSQLLMNQQSMTKTIDEQQNIQKLTTKKSKCHNCSRLVSLANHLLDCIVRIESRVNSSDESYISRLLTLYRLSQQLSRDLSMRDNLIYQLRSDSHHVSQQKVIIETRLRCLEDHLRAHERLCPLNHNEPKSEQLDSRFIKQSNSDKQTGNVPTHKQVNSSLTIRTNQKLVEVPMEDSRIAISLLQSIIACLQARLDYKDERLNQLEQLLVGS